MLEMFSKEIKRWKWKCFRKKSNVGNRNVLERNQMEMFQKKSNVCRVHLRWQIVPASCCPKDHSHALKVNALEIHNVCDTHFLFFLKQLHT